MSQAAPNAAGKRLEAMFSKLGELSMGHAVGARVTVEDDSALQQQQQQQQPLRERERQFSIAESLTDTLLDEPSIPSITRYGATCMSTRQNTLPALQPQGQGGSDGCSGCSACSAWALALGLRLQCILSITAQSSRPLQKNSLCFRGA